MAADPERKTLPFGTILLCAVAGVLYVTMLANITFSTGRGDASFGEAIAMLLFTFILFVTLALLMFAAGIFGDLPRWSGIVAILFVPLAGVATVTAIDMCSRHIKWAIFFPVVLPLLIALYALVTRFPRFHAPYSAKQTGVAAWGAVFGLSVVTMLFAAVF